MRTQGIPLWVTIYAILLTVFSIAIGVLILLDPTNLDGLEDGLEELTAVGRQWAGRNLGLGIVMGAAVLLRSQAAYVAAFAGWTVREVGDIWSAIDVSNTGLLIPPLVILVVDILALWISFKAHKMRDQLPRIAGDTTVT